MPTNFVGLVLFIAFLTPGYVHLVQRRKWNPVKEDSQLVELVGLVSISVIANASTAGVFLIARWIAPRHTPDLGAFTKEAADYFAARPGYLAAWALLLLAVSCVTALGIARGSVLLPFSNAVSPLIVEASTWYHVFEHPPDPEDSTMQSYAYLTCRLHDGTTVWGRLAWYNTDIDETADRDLALSSPIHIRDEDGDPVEVGAGDTIVLSAREMKLMHVTWVDEPKPQLTKSRWAWAEAVVWTPS